MSIYVISRSIIFDNEAFVLYGADAPDEKLRIGAIASRCFTLLADANGEIVSKRDLMSGAWGAFGLEVTENSLAQVIRQLRLALDKLQPGHELILTVPRIGYRLSAQVALTDQEPAIALLDDPTPAFTADVPSVSVTEAPQKWRWPLRLALALGALACWASLYRLPGLLYPIPLPERPFHEVDVQRIDGLTLHLENMPASALRPSNASLVARAGQLGKALDLENLNLYRFAGQDRSLNLLCSGELRPGNSHCLGLQVDE
ncbi:winged helix-turn-helix domain-containing protein [Pseudomonas sp. Pseusp97]|uniref:winged helix-turn-helix domain-containing protein n=1 Tax=Pseudomonas sp. Pseusp97 TaxID=3243065 RepID=UPI0039A478CD